MVHNKSNCFGTVHGVPFGERMVKDVDFSGHNITASSTSVECVVCDMEEAVPELILDSAGFRQVVYKLFLWGKFKSEKCKREKSIREAISYEDLDPYTNRTPDKDSIYWSK